MDRMQKYATVRSSWPQRCILSCIWQNLGGTGKNVPALRQSSSSLTRDESFLSKKCYVAKAFFSGKNSSNHGKTLEFKLKLFFLRSLKIEIFWLYRNEFWRQSDFLLFFSEFLDSGKRQRWLRAGMRLCSWAEPTLWHPILFELKLSIKQSFSLKTVFSSFWAVKAFLSKALVSSSFLLVYLTGPMSSSPGSFHLEGGFQDGKMNCLFFFVH